MIAVRAFEIAAISDLVEYAVSTRHASCPVHIVHAVIQLWISFYHAVLFTMHFAILGDHYSVISLVDVGRHMPVAGIAKADGLVYQLDH
jgi:hypothetical protein